MRDRLPVAFIMITLMLDAIGYGLVMPVMPGLLRAVTGEDLARAALWGGLLTGAFAVAQFLCGPVLGALSDRFGRRPVLLLSLAVLAGDYLLLAVAGTVWLLLLGRVMTGMAAATYGTATAYLADISSPGQKAQRFGLIGAAYGAGFILGPALGGFLAVYGLRAPFYAAAAITLANLAFGALVMRESLAPALRRRFDPRRANPFGALRALARLRGLAPLIGAFAAYQFAFTVYPVIWSYFALARFGWNVAQVGASLALYGVSVMAVQGVLIRPILRGFGRRGAALWGLGAALVVFALQVGLSSGALALALLPLAALPGLVEPALRAELSDRVGADRQGELQGALASLHALVLIAAPPLYGAIFSRFTGEQALMELPGMVFVLPFALCLLALGLLRGRRGEG